MNKILNLLLLLTLTVNAGLTMAQTGKPVTNNPKVAVLYFHPTERCPIDQSIEENTRRLMQSDFGKNLKDGSVTLQVLNTDDKTNAKIVAKFSINAQALYIVRTLNGKEVKTDLTEFAFSYGQSNPGKFRARLKEEINSALK